MTEPKGTNRAFKLARICAELDNLAPTRLAQDWDNVGLLVGDPTAAVRRVVTCIDLTPAVVEEAVRRKADLVLAYHPPIFRPITALRTDSAGTEAIVYACIRRNMAIYAVHTALDAAEGGTNDVIAALCGVKESKPIEWVEDPSVDQCKLVTFVPSEHLERVAAAVFGAGAGRIGEYTHCSYRLAGQGTFFGGESARPAVGRRGQLERVDEIRFETVVPTKVLHDVIPAMMRSHPYEEPAFDVYPLKRPVVRGIGRVGKLARPTTLVRLARKLRRDTGAACVQSVGEADRLINRAVVVVGAAGSIPFRATLGSDDVIVTGEVRHHDALRIERTGCTAIALGHWASERPVLPSLAQRLRNACPGLTVTLSDADQDPFQAV